MSNVILGSDGIAIRQGIYEQSATKKTDLGRFIDFQDGRRFRYCLCDGGPTRGTVCAAAAINGDADKVTQSGMSTQAAGETVIEVLLSDSVAAHLFDDGFLTIEADASGDSEGYIYRIKKNKAGGASVAAPCELTLYDKLQVALTSASILSLTVNRYQDVIVAPTSAAASAIGVPLIDVTDDYYFWAQTRGYAAVLAASSNNPSAGNVVSVGGTAGYIRTAQGTTYQPVGVCIQPAAASTYTTIDLMLE